MGNRRKPALGLRTAPHAVNQYLSLPFKNRQPAAEASTLYKHRIRKAPAHLTKG